MTEINERHACYKCMSIRDNRCMNKSSSYFKMSLTRRPVRNCRQKTLPEMDVITEPERKTADLFVDDETYIKVRDTLGELGKEMKEMVEDEPVTKTNGLDLQIKEAYSPIISTPHPIPDTNVASEARFIEDVPCELMDPKDCSKCRISTEKCPAVKKENERVIDILTGQIDPVTGKPPVEVPEFGDQVYEDKNPEVIQDETGKVTSIKLNLTPEVLDEPLFDPKLVKEASNGQDEPHAVTWNEHIRTVNKETAKLAKGEYVTVKEPTEDTWGESMMRSVVPERIILRNYDAKGKTVFLTKREIDGMVGKDGNAIIIRPIYDHFYYRKHEFPPRGITGDVLQRKCMYLYGRPAQGIIDKIYGPDEYEEFNKDLKISYEELEATSIPEVKGPKIEAIFIDEAANIPEEMIDKVVELYPGLMKVTKGVHDVQKEIMEKLLGSEAQEALKKAQDAIKLSEAADKALAATRPVIEVGASDHTHSNEESCDLCDQMNSDKGQKIMKEMTHDSELIGGFPADQPLPMLDYGRKDENLPNSATGTMPNGNNQTFHYDNTPKKLYVEESDQEENEEESETKTFEDPGGGTVDSEDLVRVVYKGTKLDDLVLKDPEEDASLLDATTIIADLKKVVTKLRGDHAVEQMKWDRGILAAESILKSRNSKIGELVTLLRDKDSVIESIPILKNEIHVLRTHLEAAVADHMGAIEDNRELEEKLEHTDTELKSYFLLEVKLKEEIAFEKKEADKHWEALRKANDNRKLQLEQISFFEVELSTARSQLEHLSSELVGKTATIKKLEEEHELELAVKDTSIKSLEFVADDFKGKVKKQEVTNNNMTKIDTGEVKEQPVGTPPEILTLRRTIKRHEEEE